VSAKRGVQDIATIAEDRLYCIGALVPVDTAALPISGQRDYFRDAARTYEAALRVPHRYESRAAELRFVDRRPIVDERRQTGTIARNS
jgi:hypothetical protein